MHKYELEDLLSRIESVQRDVLRHLEEEPEMVQIQGMTEVLLELRRSVGLVRKRLRRMNELRTVAVAPMPRTLHKRH